MHELRNDHRAQILKTFLDMDPNALTEAGTLPPDWTQFRYAGTVTLEGLLDLAFIITCLLYAERTYKEPMPEDNEC
jgi:hypothetical protein